MQFNSEMDTSSVRRHSEVAQDAVGGDLSGMLNIGLLPVINSSIDTMDNPLQDLGAPRQNWMETMC